MSGHADERTQPIEKGRKNAALSESYEEWLQA